MLRITNLRLPLDHDEAALRAAIVARLGIRDAELRGFTLHKRSWDARKKSAIAWIYTVDCRLAGEERVLARHARDAQIGATPDMRYAFVGHAPEGFFAGERPRPVVVGFGPCGIFAALLLAQMGLRPIVLERGKEVRERTRDTWDLWRRGELHHESNVQFGEGGAGTFSDGKLYSQISDPRHLTRKVLSELVQAGAPEEILSAGKPHIGTFRLVSMVERLRAQIRELGGEIRFQQRVVDLAIEDGALRGVTLASGEALRADNAVLAPGHSARDLFEALHARGVFMEAKPLSIGLRVEHPQSLVNRARFGPFAGDRRLGAADYKLVHHAANGRSVYSFCMCPGGTVVAATSEPGRVVTNGMSQYSRDNRNANAGIVVGLTPDDYATRRDAAGRVHPLDGVVFQRAWESRAFELGGDAYQAPAQLVGDFLQGAASSALGSVLPSYRPGVQLTNLADPRRPSLPGWALEAIREAMPAFDRKLPGFAMRDAVFTGTETRTSSPLRITRNKQRQSANLRGLYPGGEGAGYAGGIMSAAVDGIELAEAVAREMLGIRV
ncbi:MAG: NAD(P)/FAD-dependent oxidoreductase [Myxococcota bacterium]